ncbi:MAG: hypothetical protein II081_00600 [Prevotella sp.]|nr:hypothetical protein [Prevotella sp.]
MFKRLLKKYTLFTLLTFFHVVGLNAQTQTHAEATSQKWKGIDVNTVLGNSDYTDKGFPFLLYNVGTGRFIMQGGDWAMEGRLFFSDFGRQMYLHSSGRINSGITESTNANKNSFCARPPEPFSKTWSNDNYNTINLTTLMDGNKQGSYPMDWHFERDMTDTESFTYYMYQTTTSADPYTIKAPGSSYNNQRYAGKNFYLGAAWGECHNTSVGKGDGQFVFYDDDRSCWTTAEVRGNTNKLSLENGDEVEIQKLYQWRLISIDEFIEVLNSNGMGLNPSISSLIKDRDFTRNSNDFFGANDWTVSPLAGHTYENGTKRYAYTWGDYQKDKSLKNNNQQYRKPRAVNEPWDSPVRLKEVFDKWTSTNENDQAAGKKNAKYGFMTFEGVGTVTTNFQVPKPGWYEIECAGFIMSEQNHDAYLFARVISDNQVNQPENSFAIPEGEEPTYGVVTLGKLPYGTYQKDNYEHCLEAGKELLRNRDNHRQKVWVLVSEDDFNAGRKTIRLGFRKDEATRSELVVDKNGDKGYYDTDWVCVDDIRASFMGLGPVFFYEDEEDLRYLSQAEGDTDRFTPNEYAPAIKSGRYGGSANLQRKFTKNEWNTFSFPLPLTGEQVRNAFGDDCELLILHSIGNLSNNDCIIDFQTVDLITLDDVVTAGNLYMLKPTKEPVFGENPRGEMAYYYDLGKMFFSTNGNTEVPDYIYPVIDLSVWNGHQDVGSFEDKNDGCGHVTYIQTPGFSTFSVNRQGIQLANATDGSYAPKGSYAMSGGKMYELSRDTRIKGFRGWITLTHSIFEDEASMAAGARIAINGVIDGEAPTAIDRHVVVPVNPNSITAVYDLFGRKVDTSVGSLPKGIYIVNGKKLLMK